MNNTFVAILCLFLFVPFLAAAEASAEKKDKEQEFVLPMITESVTVSAKVPRELPYAATSELKLDKIEPIKPKDLTEILPSAPGAYASSGAKREWGVKLRGLGTNRITMLYDGITIYEPNKNTSTSRQSTPIRSSRATWSREPPRSSSAPKALAA